MRALIHSAAFCLAISFGMAQDRVPSQDIAQVEGRQPFRATARLVQVNVLVHDSSGVPVRDLKSDDFVVLDQGHPQRIAVFSVANPRATAGTTTASHPLTLDNRGVGHADSPSSAVVLLLDSLNMQSNDVLYVKRELPKFLKGFGNHGPLAIYNLAGPTVRVVHDFSENADSLARLAERGSATVMQSSPEAERRVTIEWTLSALESIALHVAAVPGRKSLVWISSAFPITLGFQDTNDLQTGASAASAKRGDLEPFRDRLRRLARILNGVDVAVYPVDPRGLAVDARYQATAAPGSLTASSASMRMSTAEQVSQGEFATMNLLAKETGGLAFYDANALAESIRRAVDDSMVSYTLGFYPDDESWDGRSHRLEVRVNRSGVNMRSRRSYFASDADSEPVLERNAALAAAAAVALDATAIGLTVRLTSNPLRPGAQHIEVTVDPRDIRFEQRDGKWHADFDLVLVQQTPDGRRIGGERNQCLLDRESLSDALSKPLSFPRGVVIDAAAASLRVLVRDSTTGAVGSLAVPIDRSHR